MEVCRRLACGMMPSKHMTSLLTRGSELSPQDDEGTLWDERPSTQT